MKKVFIACMVVLLCACEKVEITPTPTEPATETMVDRKYNMATSSALYTYKGSYHGFQGKYVVVHYVPSYTKRDVKSVEFFVATADNNSWVYFNIDASTCETCTFRISDDTGIVCNDYLEMRNGIIYVESNKFGDHTYEFRKLVFSDDENHSNLTLNIDDTHRLTMSLFK